MKDHFPLVPFSIILGLIVVITLIKSSITGLEQFSSPFYIRDVILSFGHLASAVYVLWLSLAIPLPTPSTPLILAGGFIFGTIKGFILAMIGEILGATIAFYIIRFAGRPLLYKLAKRSVVKRFNDFFKKKGLIAALISYAVPIFPSDVVSLFMGLTRVSYPVFLFLVIVGHIPRLFLINYLGSDLYTGITLQTTAAFFLAVLFVLAIFFREDILHALSSKAKKSKQKVVKGSKKIIKKIKHQ